EGPRLDAGSTESSQAAPQLGRGAGGERHRQHRVGRDGATGDQAGNARSDRPGLAGAGAGKDADRTERSLGGRSLLGVEIVQQVGKRRTAVGARVSRSGDGHAALFSTPGTLVVGSDETSGRAAWGHMLWEDSQWGRVSA